MTDFAMETLEVKRQYNYIFKLLKDKKETLRIRAKENILQK